jgi:protein XagA
MSIIKTIFYCSLILNAMQSFAQGWTQKKNEGYFKLSTNVISGSKFYAPNGKIIDIRTSSIFTNSLYAEFGVSNKLTAIAYVPFFVSNTLNQINYRQSGKMEPSDRLNSFGDTDFALKYGWISNKPYVLSTTLLVGLPLGKPSGGNTQILQTGDGEFNQMLRLDYSYSFYPKPFYASVYTAFNNRTKQFSDEFRYGFDIGYTKKKWTAIVHLNAVNSLFNGGVATAMNGVFSNNIEYISPAIELAYMFQKSFGISTSIAGALNGRNVLAAPSYNGGVFYKLKNTK